MWHCTIQLYKKGMQIFRRPIFKFRRKKVHRVTFQQMSKNRNATPCHQYGCTRGRVSVLCPIDASLKEQRSATFNWNNARLKYRWGDHNPIVGCRSFTCKKFLFQVLPDFSPYYQQQLCKTPSEWHFPNSNCIFPGKNHSKCFKTESRIEDSFWICDSLKVNSFYENPLCCGSQEDDLKVIAEERFKDKMEDCTNLH